MGGKDGTVVFTRNTTESINMVARAELEEGRSDCDHPSRTSFQPPSLDEATKMGVDLEVIVPDRMGRIDLADYEKAITRKTKLVAISHLSNALGSGSTCG